MKKKIHPLAEIFPELSATAFAQLKDSIDEHGQRDTIVLLADEVLDGCNRYKACLELGRTPQFRNFDPSRDGSPVKFVADKNLNRRHLTPGQRAAVAKKIDEAMKAEAAEIEEAAKKDSKPETGDKRPFRKQEAEAAKAAGASPRALRDFKFIEKYSKKDAELVTAGTITLNEGMKRAKAKKEKGSKYRNEAADLIEPDMGTDFAEKIRTFEILVTDSALKNFVRLELKDKRKVKDLVADGWGPNAALKLKNGNFEDTDTISTLIKFFTNTPKEDLDEGGWATVEVGGHVFAIGKAAAKTAAEEV